MTKKPRVRKRGTEHTISATDEEWADVRSGATEAGMTLSAWVVHCALTVDLSPGKHRRLVLEEKKQRYIARAVGEHARSLIADIDAPSQFADDLGALLRSRLETVVREGRGSEVEAILRQELGDERAAVIAAALTANVPAEAASAEAASAEAASAETASAETASAETASAEAASAETASAEAASAETASVETAPVETASAETASAKNAEEKKNAQKKASRRKKPRRRDPGQGTLF